MHTHRRTTPKNMRLQPIHQPNWPNKANHLQKIQLGGCHRLLMGQTIHFHGADQFGGLALTGRHTDGLPVRPAFGPGQWRAERIEQVAQGYAHYGHVVSGNHRYRYHLANSNTYRMRSRVWDRQVCWWTEWGCTFCLSKLPRSRRFGFYNILSF